MCKIDSDSVKSLTVGELEKLGREVCDIIVSDDKRLYNHEVDYNYWVDCQGQRLCIATSHIISSRAFDYLFAFMKCHPGSLTASGFGSFVSLSYYPSEVEK